ncbi:MAG: hypothetical protein Q7S22_05440 [Candidatus Micrarchaeota archaeon]|nr:hypothetical protein [Candidatus Micrarchaeota archaeon]
MGTDLTRKLFGLDRKMLFKEPFEKVLPVLNKFVNLAKLRSNVLARNNLLLEDTTIMISLSVYTGSEISHMRKLDRALTATPIDSEFKKFTEAEIMGERKNAYMRARLFIASIDAVGITLLAGEVAASIAIFIEPARKWVVAVMVATAIMTSFKSGQDVLQSYVNWLIDFFLGKSLS